MSVIVFANVTSTPAAKRLPYCDHVVALSSEGRIVEQGTYDKLNRSGGYVSSFDLPPPDWDFAPEKHVYEAPPKYTERAAADKVTEEDMQAEANRRTGDASIYLFYVRSVGWTATLIFVVSITIFIFGQLFPSEYIPCPIPPNMMRPRLSGFCILKNLLPQPRSPAYIAHC